MEWYISLEPKTDEIKVTDEKIHAFGYELRNAMQLLCKNDPGICALLRSTIRFIDDGVPAQTLMNHSIAEISETTARFDYSALDRLLFDMARLVNEKHSATDDYFASSRNGHKLADCMDRRENILDLRSNGLYPSNVLSNLCSNSFRLDGVLCSSMEGFLQSLKRPDRERPIQICNMKGGNARKESVASWQTDQIVW